MTRIRVFDAAAVERAVPPAAALEAVREAFLAHQRGEWTMPPKVYVTNYPAGDFRAMPALGGGHALLKWVTSFPGNPARGLPTVAGAVLLSNAGTGELEALLDAATLTALRTGAAAVLAAETLGRPDAATTAVVGAGVNGRAAIRTFLARGVAPLVFDLDPERAARVADELGAPVAASAAEALAADRVVTVTPGHGLLYGEGALRPGQHVSLMGADGPGKAEIATAELVSSTPAGDDWEPGETAVAPARRLFVDDWEQASHGGETAHAVAAGLVVRADVTELGAVLSGAAPGRLSREDITLFDSTGLAIQDLAIAIACFEQRGELEVPTIDL